MKTPDIIGLTLKEAKKVAKDFYFKVTSRDGVGCSINMLGATHLVHVDLVDGKITNAKWKIHPDVKLLNGDTYKGLLIRRGNDIHFVNQRYF